MDDNVEYITEVYYSIPSEEQTVTLDFIHRMYRDVLEDPNSGEAAISQYFSPRYIQHVDGKTLNYTQFVEHMKALKEALPYIKMTIERCMIQGNSYFTIHRANAIKKNGEEVVARIIGYFEVENGKIVLCDELTKTLVGSKEDEDLGSRR